MKDAGELDRALHVVPAWGGSRSPCWHGGCKKRWGDTGTGVLASLLAAPAPVFEGCQGLGAVCAHQGGHKMGCEAGGGTLRKAPSPPFPLPGGLQSCLRGAVRSHPLPQPLPKHEVESNYRGLKRGGRKKKKIPEGLAESCGEENLPPELPIIKFSARSSRCVGGGRLHHEGRAVSSNERCDSAKASELLQTCCKLCSGCCL